MHRLLALIAGLVIWAGGPAPAQEMSADQIAAILVRDLSPTGSMEGGQWFTNGAADGRATYALGVIHVYAPGSAGTVTIHAGIYGYLDSGWAKLREVQGLFGMSPTGAVFTPGRVEVSTMMLGPNDPRCCPTRQMRWSIDLESGQAAALN